jgi:hypothetical protein
MHAGTEDKSLRLLNAVPSQLDSICVIGFVGIGFSRHKRLS